MAIRIGDWKLLLSASTKDTEEAEQEEPASGSVQLYNLATDLGETKDLAAANPDKVKELRARLDVWMKGFVRPGQDALGVDAHPKRKLRQP